LRDKGKRLKRHLKKTTDIIKIKVGSEKMVHNKGEEATLL
jgi:hypothetical protein